MRSIAGLIDLSDGQILVHGALVKGRPGQDEFNGTYKLTANLTAGKDRPAFQLVCARETEQVLIAGRHEIRRQHGGLDDELQGSAYAVIDGKVHVSERMLDTAPFTFYGAYMDGCLTRIATDPLLIQLVSTAVTP